MDVEDVSTPLSWRSACSETTEQYQNFDHNMMSAGSDASDESMIKDAVRAEVKLKYEGGSNTVNVRVKLENVKAGHKIPTDSPLRQLILVVTATDQFEYPLVQVKGDVLPDWLGSSTPAMSQNGVDGYAGKSGNVFASVLVEDATGVSPTASYWKKTSLVSDTRLSPRDPRTLNYAFTVPDLGEIHVNVKLIYRHAFFDLMDQKDWLRPDILLLVADCHMAPGQDQELECEINPSP
jgi:hypothetical protein